MSVRAKFRVTKIERTLSSMRDGTDEKGRDRYVSVEMQTIVMTPVYANSDPDHENTKFWNATPNGELRLGTINREAAEQFELDGEYYIDFTPANGVCAPALAPVR